MDFHEYEEETGTPFWDFHRASLHLALLDRAVELGAEIETDARLADIEYSYNVSGGTTQATAILANGKRRTADLIVGADGINSRCREILLGKPDPPILTGDLAYRLLLNTEDMLKDEDLRGFVEDPQVNYWLGPDAHAGTSSSPSSFSIHSQCSRSTSKLRPSWRQALQHGAPGARRHARRHQHARRQRRRNARAIQGLGPANLETARALRIRVQMAAVHPARAGSNVVACKWCVHDLGRRRARHAPVSRVRRGYESRRRTRPRFMSGEAKGEE